MPTYEMPLLLRIMKKQDTVIALKRVANTIFETGGFIRKIENWGEKQLPCKIYSSTGTHKEASHFLFSFDVPPLSITEINDEYKRDTDVIRALIFKIKPVEEAPCTLEEELLPPPYRPSVIEMMKKSKKEKKFDYKSGLNYYPFLK